MGKSENVLQDFRVLKAREKCCKCFRKTLRFLGKLFQPNQPTQENCVIKGGPIRITADREVVFRNDATHFGD